MPTIAVDFDDTITADPPTWRRVMCHFLNAGWQVIICTGRNDTEGNRADVEAFNRGMVPVVYAGPLTKREACRKAGYSKVHVWVDDCPAMIDGAIPLLGGAP